MAHSRPAPARPTWSQVDEYSRELGGSFYVLDDALFERNFLDLQSAFRVHYDNTWIGYSYKTNYTPFLCAIVDRLGGYAEVVSEMEYELAERVGVQQNRIILNGPMKSARCISRALLGGSLVNLDSMRDLGLLVEIARANPAQRIEVALRCNFPLRSAFVSRFGFDIDGEAFKSARSTIAALPNVELVGLHCHFPDRDLAGYRTRVAMMLALSAQIFTDKPPKFLNLGGGYFSSMPAELKQSFGVEHVSFEEYSEALALPIAQAYGDRADRPKLFIEPGTALVADTLHFFARVVDVKQIGATRFATVEGSIFNISASAKKTNLPLEVVRPDSACRDRPACGTDIVGYTCIEGDCLTRAYPGPVDVGDFVHYSNVGSYSVVMKPPFILPNVAIIKLDPASTATRLIKARENFDNIFSSFVF
ncbi:type III PLP-dependent enzyme domain-containing protein [Mesorhizobium sp. A623]